MYRKSFGYNQINLNLKNQKDAKLRSSIQYLDEKMDRALMINQQIDDCCYNGFSNYLLFN